jgi:hypothetical protein
MAFDRPSWSVEGHFLLATLQLGSDSVANRADARSDLASSIHPGSVVPLVDGEFDER